MWSASPQGLTREKALFEYVRHHDSGVPTLSPGIFPAQQKRREVILLTPEGIQGIYQPL